MHEVSNKNCLTQQGISIEGQSATPNHSGGILKTQ